MKRHTIVIAAAMTISLVAGCSSARTPKESVSRVKADTVSIYGQSQRVTFPGKIRAAADINLAFRVSGTILRVTTKSGQFVKKGELLAELDPRDYQTQLAATQARYRQVKGEAERVVELYEKGSVAPNEYEKAVYGLEQAAAQYNAHKNALVDTRLRAPFDGYVQKILFERNETVSAGMPVISMISSGAPEVEINLPAADFIQMDQFDSFSCSVDIFPRQVFSLEPVGVNRKANLNQLHTMKLRFKQSSGLEMPPAGVTAMVDIDYKPSGASMVSLPLTAMFEMEGVPHVWLYNADEQRVQARKIVLSQILSDGSIVVSQGLKDGDIVVTAGVNSLHEGERVELLSAASDTNVGGML